MYPFFVAGDGIEPPTLPSQSSKLTNAPPHDYKYKNKVFLNTQNLVRKKPAFLGAGYKIPTNTDSLRNLAVTNVVVFDSTYQNSFIY